jgi:hypothetical protein
VDQLESGAVRVSLPNGGVVRVLPDQTIEVDEQAAMRAYGKSYKGQRRATGASQRVGRDGVIWLSKEADQGTVNHEAFHIAWATLTNRERSALTKRYGSEEGAAKAYGDWTPSRKEGIFEKIRRFFRSVREALFGPTAEGTFQRVAEGETFRRQARPETTPQQTDPADANPAEALADDPAYQLADEPPPRGTPLTLVQIEVRDENGRTVQVPADQLLTSLDARISALDGLKRCL